MGLSILVLGMVMMGAVANAETLLENIEKWHCYKCSFYCANVADHRQQDEPDITLTAGPNANQTDIKIAGMKPQQAEFLVSGVHRVWTWWGDAEIFNAMFVAQDGQSEFQQKPEITPIRYDCRLQ